MYVGPTTQKVFESINDVSLTDILGLEPYINLSEWKEEDEGEISFYLHISELSFEEFAKHFDKPIQEKPNTRYFMIIEPQYPLEYFQNKDKSVLITYNAFKLDEDHHLDSDDEYFTSESFYQKQTFDKEFDDNLLISLTDYLGLKEGALKINQIRYSDEGIFALNLPFKEQIALENKEDKENIEYYILDILFNNSEHNKIDVQLINDHNKITILKIFFK